MPEAQIDALVSTDWLARELSAPDVRLLDATFFLPADERDAQAEYAAKHIPGAVFMDIKAAKLPNGDMAGIETLVAYAAGLGISPDHRVVVYDNSPHHSAARGWWILRSLGIKAAVLDGGLPKWLAEGRPVESGIIKPSAAPTWPASAAGTARTLADMLANLETGAEQVVDARARARFAGQSPEPHPGVLPGHIPGSANLPQSELFGPDNRLKSRDELRAAFLAEGIDLDRPVVATCGSGVTAAVLTHALQLLGTKEVALFDGSWSQWGADPDTPKETL